MRAHQRQIRDYVNSILFFLLVLTLFPLTTQGDMKALSEWVPGLVWISVLLSILLSLAAMFRVDFLTGFIDKMMLCGHSLPMLVFCKLFVHWCVTGLPLVLLVPLIGVFFNLGIYSQEVLAVSLLLGSVSLCFLGALGVALTLGLRHGTFLLPILVMPLYVPILILGSSALTMAMSDIFPAGPLALLAAIFLVSISVMPATVGYALRLGVSE